MKCRLCEKQAVVSINRANTAFCVEHMNQFAFRQVEETIRKFKMFSKDDKILICVSGGKDSLVLWYMLQKLGYDTHGLYVSLGIEGYSDRSLEAVEKFSVKHGLKASIVDLNEAGVPIQKASKLIKRPACSVCGKIKRYYFNKIAHDGGFDVVATGHNLDDETSRLFGNLLNWQTEYLAKQLPVIPAQGDTFRKKVKPLVRMTEKEVAVFAFINGIEYIAEECPEAKGATSLVHKHAVNHIEQYSPGMKHSFYMGFLDRGQEIFAKSAEETKPETVACRICGMESFSDVCGYCDIVIRIKDKGN